MVYDSNPYLHSYSLSRTVPVFVVFKKHDPVLHFVLCMAPSRMWLAVVSFTGLYMLFGGSSVLTVTC